MKDSCLGEKEGAGREGRCVFNVRPELHAVPAVGRDPGQAPSVLLDSPGSPPELLMGLVHGVP